MRILLISILALVLGGCKVDKDGKLIDDGRIVLTPPQDQREASQIENVYFSLQAGDSKAVNGAKSGTSLSLGIAKTEANHKSEFVAEVFLSPRDISGVSKLELVADEGASRAEAACDFTSCKLNISSLLEEQGCGDTTFVAVASSSKIFLLVHREDRTQEFSFEFEPVCESTVAKTRIGERNIASVESFNPILSVIFVCVLIFFCCLFVIVQRAKFPKS